MICRSKTKNLERFSFAHRPLMSWRKSDDVLFFPRGTEALINGEWQACARFSAAKLPEVLPLVFAHGKCAAIIGSTIIAATSPAELLNAAPPNISVRAFGFPFDVLTAADIHFERAEVGGYLIFRRGNLIYAYTQKVRVITLFPDKRIVRLNPGENVFEA